MYEGQTLICQEIVEENWLEYLTFVKKRAKDEEDRNRKRQELVASVEPIYYNDGPTVSSKVSDALYPYRWYEVNLSSFWNWYIDNKIN